MSNILNDFLPQNNITYSIYKEEKSFPLYEIGGLDERYHIKKIGSFLYLNEESYDLSLLSINDVFKLILDKTDLTISIYSENTDTFLFNSALFLCDFNTKLLRIVTISKTSTNIKNIYNFKDKYLSQYIMKSFKVFDNYMNSIEYKLEDDYIQASFIDYAKLYLSYDAVVYKGRALEEYPLTELNHLKLTTEGV